MFYIRCIFSLLLVSGTMAAYAVNLIDTVNAAPGTVAITFDDGPTVQLTPKILAILKKYDVKATFFVVGQQALKNRGLLKMEDMAGQAIANHTMTHPYLTKLSDQQISDEITQSQQIIYNEIKKNAICMRYPHRDMNKHVSAIIRAKGLKPVGIDVDSEDYRHLGVKKMVVNVLHHVKSGDVILFHDGTVGSADIFEALPMIIEGIKKNGSWI